MSDGGGARVTARAASLLAALLLAGCGGGGSSSSAEWSGPPPPSADGTVSVESFVAYASKVSADWERSAAMAAAEFLRLDRRAAQGTIITGSASAEGGGPQKVVVTLYGLPDDSVRAERWTLSFVPDDGTFRLTSARRAQRCQPGRGHQRFSAEPCV